MSQPQKVLHSDNDGPEPEQTRVETKADAPTNAVPQIALANQPTGLTFAPTYAEVLKPPSARGRATAGAIQAHRHCTQQLGPLHRALSKRRLPPQTLDALLQRLDAIAKQLHDVMQTEVDPVSRQAVIDMVMGTYALMNGIWQDALAAEREMILQEKAAEQERLRNEEAERNKLPEAFAGKPAFHTTAQKFATAAAEQEFAATEADILAAKEVNLGELEPKEPWLEPKRKKGQAKKALTPGGAAAVPKEQKVAAIELAAAGAIEQAGRERDATVAKTISKIGSIAASPSGQQLKDSDLVEIFGWSGGKIPLCQTLADVAAASGNLHFVHDLAAVRDPLGVGQACLTLFTLKVKPEVVLTPAKLLARSGPGVFATWLFDLIDKPAFIPCMTFAEQHLSCLDLVSKVVPVLPPNQQAHELVGWLGQHREEDTTITWLLTCRAQKKFPDFVKGIVAGSTPVAEFRQVFTKAGSKFSFGKLVPLCMTYRKTLPALVTAVTDAEAGQLHYVRLATGLGEKNPKTLKIALKAESMLFHKTAGFTITQSKPDEFYWGTKKFRKANEFGDNRTGFLELKFPGDNATYYIHTHWMAAKGGNINSMHVKLDDSVEGVKGTELGDFKTLFQLLPLAILKAHNAAPHTGPKDLVWNSWR